MLDPFAPFEKRLQERRLPEPFVRAFRHYYEQLHGGQTGEIGEAEIAPVESLPEFGDLGPVERIGAEALRQAVVVKLNGGLGTSMGLQAPKSLLPIRGKHTFLEIILKQAEHQGVRLLIMNSFATAEPTLEALDRYGAGDGVRTFEQHMGLKVRQDDLAPVRWPANPALEWCPPGHGDIYTALRVSGLLEELLSAGVRYAFFSNVDNLGATLDPRLLGHLVQSGTPFLMEVARRSPADNKGGHLARRGDGRLVLREAAQCPEADADHFKDIERHRYFNTNNLWIDLRELDALLGENDFLKLPLIRNRKPVNPIDESSTPVYQLETAMGAAIELFDGAAAVCVPRERFAPVKSTNDLLLVRSDAYRLTDDWRLEHGPLAAVNLDPRFYKFLHDFDARFPDGPPSLRECRRFVVRGDVRFGAGVAARGEVEVVNASEAQVAVQEGTVLEGQVTLGPSGGG